MPRGREVPAAARNPNHFHRWPHNTSVISRMIDTGNQARLFRLPVELRAGARARGRRIGRCRRDRHMDTASPKSRSAVVYFAGTPALERPNAHPTR